MENDAPRDAYEAFYGVVSEIALTFFILSFQNQEGHDLMIHG
jgi:hypothetical protein